MGNPNPKCKFVKGDPRLKELGKMGGRPKGSVLLSTVMRDVLRSGKVDAEKFIVSLYKNAQRGNGSIARLLMEYNDGKPKDTLEVTGSIDSNVTQCIKVEFVRPDGDSNGNDTDSV